MADHRRGIKSFVLRQGRLTAGQARALEVLWPRFGLTIADGTFNAAKCFPRSAPLCFEIGFGMGDSLAEQARENPHINYIGVEVHRPGIGHLLMQIEHHALDNIRIYAEDSIEVLSQCIEPDSLDIVQVFFPDPWPKKKHHKRRIVSAAFIELLVSRLSPSGLLHVATDWESYAEEIELLLSKDNRFSAEQAPGRPKTKFENRGEKLGHRIRDLAFRLTD